MTKKYVLYEITKWERGVPVRARQVEVKYFEKPPEGIVPFKFNLDNTVWWPAEEDYAEPGKTYVNPDI
jgi:hypothetical protein